MLRVCAPRPCNLGLSLIIFKGNDSLQVTTVHLGHTGVDQILPVQCWCRNAGDGMEIQGGRRGVGDPLCYTPHQGAPLTPQSCLLGPSPGEMLVFPA